MPPDRLEKIEVFGSLRLDVDPVELGSGGAIDLRDVRVRDGVLRPRPGDTASYAHGERVLSIAVGSDFVIEHRAVVGSGVESLVANGGAASILVGATSPFTPSFSTTLDTGSGLRTFMVAGGKLFLYDGVTISQVMGTGWTDILAVTHLPDSGRLVLIVGQPGASIGSKIVFSGPLATGWDPTDFVVLPDEFGIYGFGQWRGNVYAVGFRSLYVIGEPSTDSVGGNVFDPRSERNTFGCNFGACCPGEQGFYFANEYGVYRTRGGPAELVSGRVDALFAGRLEAGQIDETILRAEAMCAMDGYVWVSVRVADPFEDNVCLVFDERSGDWLVDSLNATCLATTGRAVYFGNRESSNAGQGLRVLIPGSDHTGTWAWRSGYYEPHGGAMTHIRRTALDGRGTINLQVHADQEPSGAQSALNVAPPGGPRARAWQNIAVRGRRFGVELGGTGLAAVHAVEHHVGAARRAATAT